MSNRQQDIFDAMKAGFATIVSNPAPGNPAYPSNVGQKVNEWQMTPVDANADATQLPCVCLSDPRETNLGPGQNLDERSASRLFGLEFEAALLLAESDQTATKARQAHADVRKMMALNPLKNVSGIKRIEPGDSELVIDKDSNRISGVLMKFTVKYMRKTWE